MSEILNISWRFFVHIHTYRIKLVDFHLVLNCPILSRHALKNNLHLRAKCVFLKLSKTFHIRWQFLFTLMKPCKWGRTPFFGFVFLHKSKSTKKKMCLPALWKSCRGNFANGKGGKRIFNKKKTKLETFADFFVLFAGGKRYFLMENKPDIIPNSFHLCSSFSLSISFLSYLS